MHINTRQLTELLAETSGQDVEKIESQLAHLIDEINSTIAEGEAYEIEGFGIFSGIGNRMMFIPSKDLETEVNFKYVGMEPLEMKTPAPAADPTNPFDGLEGMDLTDAASDKKNTPFAGLVDDLEELESQAKSSEEAEEQPGPDDWGVSAHSEDQSANRLFASLMGEEYSPPIKDEEGIDASDDLEALDDVFGDENPDAADNSLDDELAQLLAGNDNPKKGSTESSFLDDLIEEAEEESVPADETNIDDEHPILPVDEDKDSVNDVEDHIDSIVDDEVEDEQPEQAIDEPEAEPVPEFETDALDNAEEETADEVTTALEMDPIEDFDDPFAETDASEDDDFDPASADDEEIIPVITNIASEGVAKVADKEEKVEKTRKKDKLKPKKGAPKPAPLWLWVVLFVVVTGGTAGLLGFFGVINIPFLTPGSSSSQQVAAQVQPPVPRAEPEVNTPPAAANTEEQTDTPENTQEPFVETPEQNPPVTTQTVPASSGNNPQAYGLRGELSADGADGYTIVLYSLSNQANAYREVNRLTEEGFRAIVVPIQSDRFGTLYRVSIGQFATLYNAAVAAEDIIDQLPDNYFIKKIN